MIIFTTTHSTLPVISPWPLSTLYLFSFFLLVAHWIWLVLLLCVLTGAIHWRMVNLPGVRPPKKTDSSSLNSQQLCSVELQMGRGSCAPPTSMLECWLAWSCTGLVQSAIAVISSWVQWSCHVTLVLPDFWLFSAPTSEMFPEPWGCGREGYVRQMSCLLLSTWPAVSLCIKHYSL